MGEECDVSSTVHSTNTYDVNNGDTSDDSKSNNLFMCGVVEGFYGRPWSASQRRDLFVKLKKFGLNTYMYAPKDDLKHRTCWRELYSVEEAEQLSSLINSAKDNGIVFIYALSPGLDISYSNAKDVICLKRKLEQVSQFGCQAFALLFDDIEPEISESDKEVFQSFASAQVSVTNEVFQALSQPRFLFCPTEYCTTRAVPNVQNSEYLNTIGTKLMSGIDIMWTGSKVISKTITTQSMQELSEVLRRLPVIWDNLHANDYDQKRMFLGPYSGRSTELIPHIRGVLTNPNCEYEPNFIPIHTLAQWSKCISDVKNELSSVSADIKLEAESENGSGYEDIPSHLSPTAYHPKQALKIAIQEWIPEFHKSKSVCGNSTPFLNMPVVIPAVIPAINCTGIPDIESSNSDSSIKPLEINGLSPVICEDIIKPSSSQTIDSKTDENLAESSIKESIQILEPMDCNPTPNSSPKHSIDAQMDDTIIVKNENAFNDNYEPSCDVLTNKGAPSIDSAEEMQTESISEIDDDNRSNMITFEDISLLVDLFYLPFEHGGQGLQFLQEFHWLKTNGFLVSEYRRKRTSEAEGPEVSEWYARAAKFDEMTSVVGRLLTRLTFCKNRSLLYDLYPYLWDVKGVISLLNSYVKWLALGRVPTTSLCQPLGFLPPAFTWYSKGYKEAFQSGDQEPWLFRGGLTGELQRLLPVESVSDLFLYKAPESPSSLIYTIRPYLSSDEASVYEVCRKTYVSDKENTPTFDEIPDFVGDKLIGGFLCLSSEYCFIVEDESGICGYCFAALDAQQFNKKLEMSWFPEMCNKYPLPNDKLNSGQKLSFMEELINEMHCKGGNAYTIPDVVYKNHPSILRMTVMPHIMDLSVPKRILACVIAALKANGSHGVFCEVILNDKKILDFYSKLGFMHIQVPQEMTSSENVLFLGRVF